MIDYVIEKEIGPIDFPKWLEAQTLFPKFYLKCRRTAVETVALGSCRDFFEIPASPSVKVYGAVSFPCMQKDLLWEDFPSPFFFVPQVEIIQSKEKTILKARGPTPSFKTPEKEICKLFLSDQIDLPSLEKWEKSVQSILSDIRSKDLHKAVLARRSSFKMEGSGFGWLEHLLHSSRGSSIFAFQKKPSSLFLGATPEMLYERIGRSLKTESVAGTRKRGSTIKEDLEIASLLQKNAKDVSELSYVKDFLKDSLSSLCETFSYSQDNSIIQTSKLLHLYNAFEGLLKPHIRDIDIISCLHPTPAVGALPKDLGLQKIHSLESFDRGLYAGALGWISPEESSFVVTIRSALIKAGFLHAFAGTGIVEGSDPKQEWSELEHKISHWSGVVCRTFL